MNVFVTGGTGFLGNNFVRQLLERAYGLTDVVIESAHVAYGLAVRLRAGGWTYYLKFASRSINRTPEALFGLVNGWAAHGVPVPQVLPSLSGELFHGLLPRSDYDITYLMRSLPGGLLLEATGAYLLAYAELMARLHRVGALHTPRASGGEASRLTWSARLVEARTRASTLAERSDRLSADTRGLLGTILAEAEAALPATGLPRTHIYDDLRLCHVLFAGERVTGLLDIDQATWAERLVDVYYGAVSAPDPEGGAFLTFGEIRTFLRAYNRVLPFTPIEEEALKGGLLAAMVELLDDLVGFLDAGAQTVTTEDLARAEGLFAKVAQVPPALLLERRR